MIEGEWIKGEKFSTYYQSNADLGNIIERECHLVDFEEAIRWYKHHTSNIAANMGFTVRVFVCDSGDAIVLEWIEGKVVWPNPEEMPPSWLEK